MRKSILNRLSNSEKTWLIVFIIVVALMVLNNFFKSNKTPKLKNDISRKVDTAGLHAARMVAKRQSITIDSFDHVRELRKEHAIKELPRLKSKFRINKDEFNSLEFYHHWGLGKGWPNKKTIYAVCNSDGYVYLVSNYFDDDWIFHTKIAVKYEDGTIIETDEVPSIEKSNRHRNDGGFVWENISYENGDRILERIAENTKQRVLVRFMGGSYYKDITLDYQDKEMIAETIKLRNAINDSN